MSSKKKKNIPIRLPAARCSKEEYAVILARAENAGMNLSEYIRQASSGKKIEVSAKADPQLVFQLKKLAVNLNEQTRKMRQSGSVPTELKALWERINQMLDKIILEKK